MRLALPMMSMDQRRATGVTPGKLVVPNEFQHQLADAITISRPLHVRLQKRVDNRVIKYDTAVAGAVVRIVPEQAQYIKTCRVLAVGCKWHEMDDDEVYEAVLTGVAAWDDLPTTDSPSLTFLGVL